MKAKRMLAALAVAAGLAIFATGCNREQKVAARVNKDVITEQAFLNRVQAVNAMALGRSAQSGGPTRAGEFAMRDMIMERLLLQAAADKGVAPTDSQVKEYVAFDKQYPVFDWPESSAPGRTDAEWLDFARRQVAVLNLERKAVTITPAEIKQVYDNPNFQRQVEQHEAFHLRIIGNSTLAKSQAVLAALKKGVPFETEALKDSEDPSTRQKSGDVGYLLDTQMRPELLAAVEKLKPNEYTTSPVVISSPQNTRPPSVQKSYVLVQLIDKRPAKMPPMDDLKLGIESTLLRRNAQAMEYVQSTLRDFVSRANIQVNLKQYADLAQQIKASVSTMPSTPSAPSAPQPAR